VTCGCCCGHGIYPKTIVVRLKDGKIREHFTCVEIPRKRRFYLTDEKGYYYIPEVLKELMRLKAINGH
jgi:hypothetical protein